MPLLAQLKADFTSDRTGGCSPLIVKFTNTSSNASASATYQWDLGNGNNATVRDAQAVFTVVGTYTIILTVQDGGITSTSSHTVTVYPRPGPSFSFSPAVVCGAQPIQFAGRVTAGAGPSMTWLWDFGDGTTATVFGSVTHTYASSVDKVVSLTVTNTYGCTDTVSMPVKITVLTPAVSAFTSDKQVLCNVSDPVQFTNSSSGPGPLTYSWDFGDGTTSALPNPAHSYTQKGSYTVKLKTTTVDGCSATSSQVDLLNVADYHTDFDAPSANICQFTNFSFTDKSSPAPDSRSWRIDGAFAGNFSPMSYTFSTAGTHTVELDNVFGACPQSISKTITVNPAPAAVPFDQQETRSCTNYLVQFTDHTPDAVAWSWNFNGTTETPSSTASISSSFVYGLPYVVRLKVTNGFGCTSIVSGTVFDTKSIPSIYEPSPSPSKSCQTPITKTYAIQNASILQSFHWDFGDGVSSTDPSPTHTYTGVGIYNPILYYTDVEGCSGSVGYTSIVISAPFSLDFTADATTVCSGTTVTFSSPSLAGAGAVEIHWQYGDGSDLPTNHYLYNHPGTYTVTLSAKNAGGCPASVSKSNYITVIAPPGNYGGHTYTCNGDRDIVTFTYAPGTATSVLWDFGDGTSTTTGPSTTQVQHQYPRTGIFYPNITASNAACDNMNSDHVYVLKKQTPILGAASNAVCEGGSLQVSVTVERNPWEVNSGYYDDYTPVFRYGDGSPFIGTITPTSNSNYSNGAFTWILTGFTVGKSGLQVTLNSFGFGCVDYSNVIPLTVRGAVTPAFVVSSDNHCYTQPVILTDQSTGGSGNPIVSAVWDFGDGQTAASGGGPTAHRYVQPGQYAVRLTVTDAAGCVGTSAASSGTVNVLGPLASFAPLPGVSVNLNTTVYFSNNSNTYGCINPVWSWDFGDGAGPGVGATDRSPSHTYPVPGDYPVTLTATDPSNPNACASTVSTTIHVKNFNSHFSTTASYVGNSGCPPVLAQFFNTSSNYQSVSWDFGDGWTAGNVNSPSHVYQQPGRYIVTLHVIGYNGLTDSYIDSVFVREPSASMRAEKPLVCLGQPAVYKAAATSVRIYTWDFGDGSVGSGVYPDSVIGHNYAATGDYTARLVVTDTFGCAMAAAVGVDITVHSVPNVVVSPAETFMCQNTSVTLSASGGQAYQWSPATGLDRTDQATVVASPFDNTVYQVTAWDDVGCSSTAAATIKIVYPQTIAVAMDSTSVCDGSSVALVASGTDLYNWIDDVVGTDKPGTVIAKPSQTTVYTVIGMDIHRCFSDTATIKVTVLPTPTVNAGPDVEVLAGNPIVLQATGSTDITKWEWTPAIYLSCTDCAQPVSSPRKPEEYIVTVKNDVGCSASDTVEAKILCEESRVRIPEAFSPNGDGHNDRFVILGIGEVRHLVIYNRWGVKVWEKNNFYPADAASCWDGMVNGQPAPVGAYAYYVEMDCPVGGVFGRRGTVVLVR